MKEGVWVLNAAPIATYPGWAAGQPDNGGINSVDESALMTGEDCVFQSGDGYWYDTSCTAATEYPWACTDGYVWKVTQVQGRAQKPADGHKACFNEFGSTFVFAAPLSKKRCDSDRLCPFVIGKRAWQPDECRVVEHE